MPVGYVNYRPDLCCPRKPVAVAFIMRVALLAVMPEVRSDTLRVHARAGRPSEANSRDLDHGSIRIDVQRIAVFVVVHLFGNARVVFFAPDSWVGAGVFLRTCRERSF